MIGSVQYSFFWKEVLHELLRGAHFIRKVFFFQHVQWKLTEPQFRHNFFCCGEWVFRTCVLQMIGVKNINVQNVSNFGFSARVENFGYSYLVIQLK